MSNYFESCNAYLKGYTESFIKIAASKKPKVNKNFTNANKDAEKGWHEQNNKLQGDKSTASRNEMKRTRDDYNNMQNKYLHTNKEYINTSNMQRGAARNLAKGFNRVANGFMNIAGKGANSLYKKYKSNSIQSAEEQMWQAKEKHYGLGSARSEADKARTRAESRVSDLEHKLKANDSLLSGLNPMTYVNKYRLNKAKGDLQAAEDRYNDLDDRVTAATKARAGYQYNLDANTRDADTRISSKDNPYGYGEGASHQGLIDYRKMLESKGLKDTDMVRDYNAKADKKGKYQEMTFGEFKSRSDAALRDADSYVQRAAEDRDLNTRAEFARDQVDRVDRVKGGRNLPQPQPQPQPQPNAPQPNVQQPQYNGPSWWDRFSRLNDSSSYGYPPAPGYGYQPAPGYGYPPAPGYGYRGY